MNAIHLLRSFKHGGGETVAYNYSRILSKLGVSNTFVAQQESQLFEEMLKKVGQTKYSYGISDVRNADLIFVNSTIDLIKLCLYRMLPLGWSKKKVIYTQHLNKSESKFRLISMLVNFCCTDFIQITPFTKHLVEKYIKVRVNFIVNFELVKKILCSFDRTCNQLRKEGYKEGVCNEILFCRNLSIINIDGISQCLECIEGNSNGKKYIEIWNNYFGSKNFRNGI